MSDTKESAAEGTINTKEILINDFESDSKNDSKSGDTKNVSKSGDTTSDSKNDSENESESGDSENDEEQTLNCGATSAASVPQITVFVNNSIGSEKWLLVALVLFVILWAPVVEHKLIITSTFSDHPYTRNKPLTTPTSRAQRWDTTSRTQRWDIYHRFDSPGNNLNKWNDLINFGWTLDQCQTRCELEERCVGFGYNPNLRNGYCVLKHTIQSKLVPWDTGSVLYIKS